MNEQISVNDDHVAQNVPLDDEVAADDKDREPVRAVPADDNLAAVGAVHRMRPGEDSAQRVGDVTVRGWTADPYDALAVQPGAHQSAETEKPRGPRTQSHATNVRKFCSSRFPWTVSTDSG
ncbi:MAG: hypothetical protein NVS1B4_05810 [Gemmatimonadaceae bacterium]